jgi:hypothetical protein
VHISHIIHQYVFTFRFDVVDGSTTLTPVSFSNSCNPLTTLDGMEWDAKTQRLLACDKGNGQILSIKI